MNYYNENDPKAAAWLRELICQGLISEGVVDERSIVDVLPSDLREYKQCHFFAGIGGWSYALRLAGVPDDEPVWTGSCPCQPFSTAGLQLGTADARHLWPIFFNLIRQCCPATIFGEQVASKAGRSWLAGVFADLESVAYAAAGADLCAAGVGAPHIRQRLWWVAHSNLSDQNKGASGRQQPLRECFSCNSPSASRVEYSTSNRREEWRPKSVGWGTLARLGDDGFYRRIDPRIEPLATRLPNRMDFLRGYGNAIVPELAAQFTKAFYEARQLIRNLVRHAQDVEQLDERAAGHSLTFERDHLR